MLKKLMLLSVIMLTVSGSLQAANMGIDIPSELRAVTAERAALGAEAVARRAGLQAGQADVLRDDIRAYARALDNYLDQLTTANDAGGIDGIGVTKDSFGNAWAEAEVLREAYRQRKAAVRG